MNKTTPLVRKIPFLPLNASQTGCGTELSSKDASMLLIRRKKDQLRQKLKEVSLSIEEEDRMSTITISKAQTEEEVSCSSLFGFITPCLGSSHLDTVSEL